ncbi:tRNA1(Val) (adenine(37)-N6)-methyltransferase [Cypionkella sp.]|jgi:tRNA1(Val) A37 N6-methylase TrmN6|uniref:tRNA1(Val) (adenine(37)-N6)-methyltransferase n=1 Tax=Cypionkella sp. TaxID=2811411 RepID=UPI002716CA75|nr:methyltransferase [Cypionkella sp.]MDO8983068.1 methyltransferase [Cypionkella sp.]MDP2049383.1 methyltransferase [Cypionkella sp.]
MDDLTQDAFLCGKLQLWQPRHGYRAATDPVLLAAACPARPGQSVLDLGCGVGAAAFCLARRVPDLRLAGLEVQPDYAALAQRNAVENGIAMQVEVGDLADMPKALRVDFDHVIANPPYYPKGGTPSPNAGRATALQIHTPLGDWVQAASRRLAPGGWLTLICGADGLPEVLAAMAGKLGSAAVLPLTAREGKPALRILLRARKTGRAAFRLLAPFVIHHGTFHDGDRESYTARASEILRGGESLSDEFR